ncbi:hypothetical protein I3842_03G239900 [Carya illinoinensis]|uniref:Heparanase-like protein 3 n=1 Tax=Carya illinoinensis TaxID=32201 RepID=A0A922FKU3_CARIL|nr:hypothetical protein I3842_03G239900 [Carya illinoinensis]
MSSPVLLVWIGIWMCVFSHSAIIPAVGGDGSAEGTVFVDSQTIIGRTDKDFICATLDWWPPEKCDYGTCSWGHASLLNLNLSNNILANAIKAFSPLKLRLGGSLEDQIIYDTEDNRQPCLPFVQNSSAMFNFSHGCLPMPRWDELNALFKKTGAKIIFGLNALSGRTLQPDGTSTGTWDHKNAESFMRYTVSKNYTIHGWELGNELCAGGVGTRVLADQYALDTTTLADIVQRVYKGIKPKPLILAPGGFFDEKWFIDFIDRTTPTLGAVTHHLYNLGAGIDKNLVNKILDPSYLDRVYDTFKDLLDILKMYSTRAVAWVGESGGAYNSGHHLVTNAFVFSFWYLDQLGMSSAHDTKTYCRQSFIGGNYGLLNTTTFEPNPDYYSALLWHRLMGRNVLPTSFSGTKKIRAYAHCSRVSRGITLLLINLDNSTTVYADVAFNSTGTFKRKTILLPPPFKGGNIREEFHLTAKDGDLHSQTVLLNGNILAVNSAGDIPPFVPVYVNSLTPIQVAPYSIVFAHLPNADVPACRLRH